MIVRVGIENNAEGRSTAWALAHPGCFSYGRDGASALAQIKSAVQDYVTWVTDYGGDWLAPGGEEIKTRLEETWHVYRIDKDFELADEGYEVESWFRYDWKPLTGEDVARGLKLLSWSRADLLAAVSGLSTEELEKEYPGERWNIGGIVRHVGGAEWWYLDRLGLAFPQADVPKTPFERIQKVRTQLVEVLPTLVGSTQVVGLDGEIWSARKVLRRAVWHERDHVTHIRKLLGR